MDYHYLRAINLQLETLIQERQRSVRPGLGLLFEAGCGFTEFLVRIKENYKEREKSFVALKGLRNFLVSTRRGVVSKDRVKGSS